MNLWRRLLSWFGLWHADELAFSTDLYVPWVPGEPRWWYERQLRAKVQGEVLDHWKGEGKEVRVLYTKMGPYTEQGGRRVMRMHVEAAIRPHSGDPLNP